MKNFLKIFFVTLLVTLNTWINLTSATFFNVSTPQNIAQIDKNEISSVNINIVSKNEKLIKIWDMFISFANYYEWKIPESYKYIKLNFTWVSENTELYRALQKLVYVNVLPNWKSYINKNNNLSAYNLYKIAEKLFDVNLVQSYQIKWLKDRNANENDLIELKKVFIKKPKVTSVKEIDLSQIKGENNSKLIIEKQKIFLDVYETIKDSHYNKNEISDIELLESATKWLAEGSWDKFTTYFPPVENKDFMESLDWKFEWIGSYVEMEEAGVLRIISPIPGSPSEKAGIQWWDIIIKADGKEILETTSLREWVSWIKWPKWTPVVLTILRKWKVLEITVIRDTIIIKNVESKKLNSSTYYIKLTTFWENISSEFTETLKDLEKERWVKKVIFDLRNNPGWYLGEVSDMLWHFVPKWEPTAVVKYLSWEQNYTSEGYDLIDFSKYRIIILQNWGSASASEIFVWTIKDYFPNATIIGEQSYWKGSVQTIKPYSDGSSFKYTIAKWFTWKTKTGIDWIWIPVDIKLEFDYERFKETEYDNQLEKAKSIR
jgi:carboxyl-terminal processing protease